MNNLPTAFLDNVKVEADSDCLLWQGFITKDGYGLFRVKRSKQYRAHRFAYTVMVGEIPEGYTIDHLCRVRNCVNWRHLEAVTNKTNVLRGEGITAKQARQTHCKNGHEFTEDNIYKYRGARICKTCMRVPFRKSRAKLNDDQVRSPLKREDK